MTTITWPELRVRIGFSADPTEPLLILDDDDRGELDEGLLAPDDGAWTDVSAFLVGDPRKIALDVKRGRSSPLTDYEVSRCTVRLRNVDGRFDPLNLDGPYVIDGVTLIEPGRRLWATAEVNGTQTDRFYGFIRDFTFDVDSKGDPIVVVTALGVTSNVATFDPDESASVGGGEDTGARMHRLFDLAEVLDGDRDFDTGDSTVQPTTLAQNVLTEAKLTAASELGALYELGNGKVRFDRRRAIINEARSREVQATFGPPGVVGALPYASLVPAYDKEELRNDVTVARKGGGAQVLEDATSKAKYQPKRFRRTDLLLETDLECLEYAEWVLAIYATTVYRYTAVVIDPLACADSEIDAMWAAVLDRELRDRIAVVEEIEYRDVDTGEPFTREATAEVFIDQIHEQWRNPRSCTITFGLSSAEAFRDNFILDEDELDGDDRLALF